MKLYVYEAIREDAHLLYGFVNKKEREMFLLLITVSGVGANTARMMLSGMSVAELCNAISTGNAKHCRGDTCGRCYGDTCKQRGEGRGRFGPDDAGIRTGTESEGGVTNLAGAA